MLEALRHIVAQERYLSKCTMYMHVWVEIYDTVDKKTEDQEACECLELVLHPLSTRYFTYGCFQDSMNVWCVLVGT